MNQANADLIFFNGKIFTGTGEGGYVIRSAAAVKDGLISAVGDDETILAMADDRTELVDCHGNTVLPGLCDAHCHGSWNIVTASCDLFGITDENGVEQEVAEIQERLRTFAEAHPDEPIVRGAGFNMLRFPGDRRPTRQDLDAVCADRPVVLTSFCGHGLWANTRAIELCGLDASTSQPDTGSFETEADGYPMGLFHEPEGIALVSARLPGYNPDAEAYKKIILYYQETCVAPYGVTLVQDCGLYPDAIEAYKELAREGKLKMRVRGVYLVSDASSDAELETAAARRASDRVDDLFEINTTKYFMEGSFALLEPYTKEFTEAGGLPADYCGETTWDAETVKRSFRRAAELGFQIHCHAMGDASVHQTVEALDSVIENGDNRLRHAIAHLMLVPPADRAVMGRDHIVASLQPRWMVYDNDIHSYFPLFGQTRAEQCYPDRSLSDAGAVVAYGTDFPVTPPPNPYHGIQCAVTREVFPDAPDYEPNKGLVLGPGCDGSSDMVTLEEAVVRTTRNGAYQMFLENVTGSILPGMSAELVLLDRDLAACPVHEIYSTKVVRSVFKGKTVYRSEDNAG